MQYIVINNADTAVHQAQERELNEKASELHIYRGGNRAELSKASLLFIRHYHYFEQKQ
jgi:hypothetical protein